MWNLTVPMNLSFDIPKDSEEYGEPAEVIYISEGDTDITRVWQKEA